MRNLISINKLILKNVWLRYGALMLVGWIFSGIALAQPYNRVASKREMSEVIRQFDSYLAQTVKKAREPGCAVAIVYKNEIIFVKGYGVRQIGKPARIDANTVFQLGSVSKTFTATLAALLHHRGVLNLNAPVRRFLPSFHLRNIAANNLRVKYLLSHTTGIPRGGFNNLIEASTPYPKLLQKAQNTSPVAEPGTRYDYHNVMFSLTGDVIASATERSFRYAMTQNLLNPLNMRSTTMTLHELIHTSNRALPHVRTKKGAFVPTTRYSSAYYSVLPSAGISSNARDMAQFLKLQLGGYPNLLDKNQLQIMYTPQVKTPLTLRAPTSYREKVRNAYYGLGWRILEFADKRLVFHGGWLKGFTNFIGFMPDEEVGIVVLHNAETRLPTTVAMKFFDLYLNAQN